LIISPQSLLLVLDLLSLYAHYLVILWLHIVSSSLGLNCIVYVRFVKVLMLDYVKVLAVLFLSKLLELIKNIGAFLCRNNPCSLPGRASIFLGGGGVGFDKCICGYTNSCFRM